MIDIDEAETAVGHRELFILGQRKRGIVNIGGYRFPLGGVLEAIGRVEPRASLAAMPDDLLGHRLVATAAADPNAVRAVINAAGLNPLIATAFAAESERRVCAFAAG